MIIFNLLDHNSSLGNHLRKQPIGATIKVISSDNFLTCLKEIANKQLNILRKLLHLFFFFLVEGNYWRRARQKGTEGEVSKVQSAGEFQWSTIAGLTIREVQRRKRYSHYDET